jgi:hypothetical protein
MPRPAGLGATAVLAAALAACGSAAPPALAPYADATLTPSGLGDLQLGTTTLGQVMANLPPEAVDGVAADWPGLELQYAGRELSLLFVIDQGPCWMALRDYSLRRAAADVPALLAAVPACAEVPLASLAVRGRFWRGATDRGVRLGDPMLAAVVHGEPVFDAPGFVHAGMLAAPPVRIDFPDGLSVFGDGTIGSDGPPIEMVTIRDPATP